LFNDVILTVTHIVYWLYIRKCISSTSFELSVDRNALGVEKRDYRVQTYVKLMK